MACRYNAVILAEFDSYSNSELTTMVIDQGQNLDETQYCSVNISAMSYFPVGIGVRIRQCAKP